MSEQSATPALSSEPKGTVSVSRKVNLGNYESEEVTVYVQYPVFLPGSRDDYEAATVAAANDAAFQAKTVVYAQLGITPKLVEGVLRAAVEGTFPGTTVEAATATVVATPPSAPIPASSVETGAAPSAPAASVEGSPIACPKCQGPTFDNREANVARANEGKKALPEARCRAHADPPKGTGCKGVIWSIAKGK